MTITMSDKCTSACFAGRCDCGAIVNDVVHPGRTIHIPLMMKDGAPVNEPKRKTLSMMTDSEKRTMRDSVKTMKLADAAKLSIYDDVRGSFIRGIPAAEYFAAADGASTAGTTSDAQQRAQAYKDHAAEQSSKAWQGPGAKAINDNTAPLLARDGRPMAQLDARERALEQRVIEQTNAWKR